MDELPINQLLCGDAVELTKKLSDDSIHSIVTDPPYGLEFMGEEWDKFTISHKRIVSDVKNYQEWTTAWAREALRVLKPGASMLVMGGTRTHHRMMCGVEDAGFIIKDMLLHCYNSGFPKSQDLGMMFDKQECRRQLGRKLGRTPTKAEFKEAWEEFREVVGRNPNSRENCDKSNSLYEPGTVGKTAYITKPTTLEAKKWDGWKVGGVKPSYEPVIWAVKPPNGAIIDNVLKHGVGAINVEACRIPYEGEDDKETARYNALGMERLAKKYGEKLGTLFEGGWEKHKLGEQPEGRYPSNMIRTDRFEDGYDRFYFVPKASRAERDEGLDGYVLNGDTPPRIKRKIEKYISKMTYKHNL